MYQEPKQYQYDIRKPKSVPSDEITTSFSLKNGKIKTNNVSSDPGKTYEVFRNNTTAVEVIVKEIGKPKRKTVSEDDKETNTRSFLQGDINTLKKDLNTANATIAGDRTQYQALIRELKKQLDNANKREMDAQTKNLVLLIENEKLKSLLNSKTNLLDKLKKELTNMKCLMKFVIKTICHPPQAVTNVENATLCSTDPEYDDFENDLQKDVKHKFAVNMFDAVCTFDSSSVSKEVKFS